jgi:hypothetical protein
MKVLVITWHGISYNEKDTLDIMERPVNNFVSPCNFILYRSTQASVCNYLTPDIQDMLLSTLTDILSSKRSDNDKQEKILSFLNKKGVAKIRSGTDSDSEDAKDYKKSKYNIKGIFKRGLRGVPNKIITVDRIQDAIEASNDDNKIYLFDEHGQGEELVSHTDPMLKRNEDSMLTTFEDILKKACGKLKNKEELLVLDLTCNSFSSLSPSGPSIASRTKIKRTNTLNEDRNPYLSGTTALERAMKLKANRTISKRGRKKYPNKTKKKKKKKKKINRNKTQKK